MNAKMNAVLFASLNNQPEISLDSLAVLNGVRIKSVTHNKDGVSITVRKNAVKRNIRDIVDLMPGVKIATARLFRDFGSKADDALLHIPSVSDECVEYVSGAGADALDAELAEAAENLED